MIETKPKVYLIAHTTLADNGTEMADYLRDIGAEEYIEKELDSGELTDGEEVVRFAAKLCYNSFVADLNPNVTKVTEGGNKYLGNILNHAHGAVLEHTSATFLLRDVSRVLTHELVRHRVGIAYSQESLRYCRLTDLRFWMPSVFNDLLPGEDAERMKEVIYNALSGMEGDQREMANIANIDGLTFADKKKLTSAFRRIAPMGLATKIVFTANVRTLRHLILLRTSPHAEEEIRIVFNTIALRCQALWPSLFSDFVQNVGNEGEIPVWTCTNSQQPYGGA